jgi:hypothetical protein
MTGTNWEVQARSDMMISGSMDVFKTSTSFKIISGSPLTARSRAEKYASLYSNDAEFIGVSTAGVQAALKRTATNPACGLIMTKSVSLRSDNGSSWAKISFDRPVPYYLIPNLTKERVQYEMAQGLSVTEVIATIDSNDPKLGTGVRRRGGVEIKYIVPTLSATDSTGKAIRIGADYAYRLSSKYERASTDASIPWLDQVTDYYIKGGKVVAIVARIPRKELSEVYYVLPEVLGQ